jgi:hypothetical protein
MNTENLLYERVAQKTKDLINSGNGHIPIKDLVEKAADDVMRQAEQEFNCLANLADILLNIKHRIEWELQAFPHS